MPRTLRVLICLLSVAMFSLLAFAQDPDEKEEREALAAIQRATEKNVATSETPANMEELQRGQNRPGGVAGGDEASGEGRGGPQLNGLRWRSIGPAFVSGRIATLAVNPKNHSQWFVGAASGGVWKTDNAGITFTPVFDTQGSYSIGFVTIDPKDTNTVWVGTGENNAQRSVSYGDGVYRSDDGGRTWKNMGLKKSEHIARILIDPRDSKVVYVAAQGPLWGPGGDRGLYKTIDGGKTWTNILKISDNTGVTDVVMDPSNPDVLLASAWQRRRHVYTLIDGGPESALYRSTDAGATWNKVTGGLPTGDVGRIGLAVTPADPNVVFAIIEGSEKKGGIFRSGDKGVSWERRNEYDTTSMYYATIFLDPKNADRLYVMGLLELVSDDGGRNLRSLGERSKHVDNHILWIDPDNGNHYINGCDGGLYESYDRAATWRWFANLPLGQFYDVAVDMNVPFYHVYGGTQDNNSLGGPARNKSQSGIVNSDWYITTGGDGFRSQADPEDNNTTYAESQNGGLVRYDKKTGQRVGIQPQDGPKEILRWNWDAPIIISPHSHTRLYFAAQKLFRSDDRGDSWTAISGDLTRNLDRDSLKVFDKVWTPEAVAKNASTELYGNISALAESPKQEGVIYAGTDDGLIQVTLDGGKTWNKYEKFPGVGENYYVARLVASRFDANTVYAGFDGHKYADFKPYLFKSTDAGKTWTNISANLPENGYIHGIAEDTVDPNLLFCGTEFGAWFSNDGGGRWQKLGSGLPTIAVHDMLVHPKTNDLVIATFGRSFYVLDDISPLRSVKRETLSAEATLFPVKDALMYIESSPLGGRGKAFQGESYYEADNPPYGATFSYYLKEKYKSLKEVRQDKEKAAAKDNNGDAYPKLKYPTPEELRAEAEQEPPSVWFTITDAQGTVVRRLPASNAPGLSRTTWNLRYPATTLPPPRPAGGGGEPDLAEIFGFGPSGNLVIPGDYTVTLSKKVDGKWSDLSAPQKFHIVTEGQDKADPAAIAELHDFLSKVAKLNRAVSGAVSYTNELKSQVDAIRRALRETTADTNSLIARGDALNKQLADLLVTLRGDEAAAARQDPDYQSISGRVGSILGDHRTSLQRPTKSGQSDYTLASTQFSDALAELRKIADAANQLGKDAERAGAPWTPGRMPEWSDK